MADPARSHYRVLDDPEIVYTVNFSGGASSGYMLAQILAAYDGRLPANAHVVFCNTGMEREATLRFVHEFGLYFGVKIAWLEYRFRPERRGVRGDPKQCHAVVTYETASRAGQPFAQLIGQRQMLPNPAMRFCSIELKRRTTERYMRRDVKANGPIRHIIGFRADEYSRFKDALWSECLLTYPMVAAQITETDVRAYWRSMPFRLSIDSYQGNCTLCMIKSRAIKRRIIREEGAAIADWWIDQETQAETAARRAHINAKIQRFNARYSYAELVATAHDGQEDFTEGDLTGDCWCGD